MTPKLTDYITVKEAAEITGLAANTIYFYLTKNAIKGAIRIAGVRWMLPKKWAKDYKAGKINVKGIFRGRYLKYGKKSYDKRK